MFITTKNPKSLSSMRNKNFATIRIGGEVVGIFVRFLRDTFNKYGNQNVWECIQYIPINFRYSAHTMSEYLDDREIVQDLKLWGRDPKCVADFHTGKRNGEVENIYILDEKHFIPKEMYLRESSSDEMQSCLGKIWMSWSGKDEDIVNNDVYISSEVIYHFCGDFLTKITSENIDCIYAKRGEKKFYSVKEVEDFFNEKKEEEEAPSEEENDEPRPKRQRRCKPEGEYPLACN